MSALPDGWPEDFPLPDGASPVVDESEPGTLRVSFSVPGDVDVPAFFTAHLPRSGWLIEDVDEENTIEIDGHGFYGQIEMEISQPASGFCVQLVR